MSAKGRAEDDNARDNNIHSEKTLLMKPARLFAWTGEVENKILIIDDSASVCSCQRTLQQPPNEHACISQACLSLMSNICTG